MSERKWTRAALWGSACDVIPTSRGVESRTKNDQRHLRPKTVSEDGERESERDSQRNWNAAACVTLRSLTRS